jgi:hypothetical protein
LGQDLLRRSNISRSNTSWSYISRDSISRYKKAFSLCSGAAIVGVIASIAPVQAQDEIQPQDQLQKPQETEVREFPQDLAAASDQELTFIAANWPQLSALQRRALLVETTRRMDSKKRASSAPSGGRLSISVQRRYGLSQNGSVVISTRRVVKVRPGGPSQNPSQNQSQSPSQQVVVVPTPRSATPSSANARVVNGKPVTRASFGEGFESRRAQEVRVENVQEEPKPAP